MSFIFDLADWVISNPEVGWVVVVAYLMWEIRGPGGKIGELTDMIESTITVVRGIARANEKIDNEAVDQLLTENAKEPMDFVEEDEPSDEKKRDAENLLYDDETVVTDDDIITND